jgi:class 3 adenylate cyclase/tetratricopeptide (TPR) repeat protein
MAPLSVCPSCGHENPEGFRFCGSCGASLAAEPPSREERKRVTVLFCDLVGFTAASDRADPEDVRARLRPYHARVRADIDRFGGTVEKFIGDAVMAVYGAPVAHEDDAERAVRSALRIVESIDELNASDPGLGLHVRIGIDTGEAVVALGARPETGEGIVTGDVVNTASRLQGIAPVGGIAVGEQTYRATRDVFEYQGLAAATVKGKAHALPVWQPRSARARFGSDLRVHRTPLVGRQIDLGILTGAFEKARQESAVQLVTIVGEPGVGKSRLLGELYAYIDALPEPVRWRQGRCLPYGEGVTFWALGEIVKAEAGILESDPPEIAGAKLERVVPDGPDREWLRQRLLPLVGLGSSSTAEQDESFTAWRRFLESLAEHGPAIVVFEDLQWADTAMLDFLEHLADWSEGVPMLVAATTRPELYERRPNWSGGKRNATTISLAPLSDTETSKLITLLLDQPALPAEMGSLIVDRAGGNPLYAEEFVRLLRDRDLLRRSDGRLVIAPGTELPIPDSVQALVAARLDTLAPERKALLQDAAVIGKVFWADGVAAMANVELRTASDAMHELSRMELIRSTRQSSMAGQAEYSFWHILVRDVAYAQIPRAERAAKHARAAAWIESVAGERVEDHAEILAHHYVTALQLSRSVGGASVADLEAAALRFLLLAGERALGLDVAKAQSNLDRALQLAPPGHPQRPEVLDRWAEAARQEGRHGEAAHALDEAIAAFRQRGDTLAAARGLTTLASVLWWSGSERRREVAIEATTLLEGLPPGPDLVAAYAELARQEVLGGNLNEGIRSAERALALAGELGLEEPAKALGYLALGRCWLGDGGGVDDFRRALSLALAQGRGWETSVLYNNLAVSLWAIEGPAASVAMFRQGIEFGTARGIADSVRISRAEMLDEQVDLGAWDEVLGQSAELEEGAEATWSVPVLADMRRARVRVLLMRGEAEAAMPLARWAVESADRLPADRARLSLCLDAMASHASGDLERARSALRRLVGTQYWENLHWPAYLPAVIRVAVALGETALAETLMANETRHRYRGHAQVAAQALVAEASGQPEAAARLHGEAAERWEGFGVVHERAFALLGRGRCLVALGRSKEAVGPLRGAREIFASLRAGPALVETNAFLERTGAQVT